MHDPLLCLFHQMPPLLRNVAASINGLRLRYWRYGPETEGLVAEALERDHWSPGQWKLYQENQLLHILRRAATQVPYYRRNWAERRRSGDRASWEYLENWPILEKEALRQHPKDFVADDYDLSRLFHEHTSGTTGKPVNVYRSRKTLRAWYALFEARWRRWYGVSMDTRWAILGGRLVTPVAQEHPPFWVWNQPMNQLYLSSYHISPNTVESYLSVLEKYDIEYIYCYTSAGYSLADEILRKGLTTRPLKVVVTNAEPVYDYQRDRISKAFGCPVRETYGQTESVIGASECEFGRMHLWPEVGFYEIVDSETPVLTGLVGDVLSTGLLDDSMILVRYRVGDRMALDKSEVACSCGRRLPLIKQIEGRNDDVLYTPDGRRVGRLDPVFKSDLALREAQIVQDRLDHLTVRVVPAEGYGKHTADAIRQQLQARMGAVDVEFETIDSIPRTANGKFRAVVCNLSPDDLKRAKQM